MSSLDKIGKITSQFEKMAEVIAKVTGKANDRRVVVVAGHAGFARAEALGMERAIKDLNDAQKQIQIAVGNAGLLGALRYDPRQWHHKGDIGLVDLARDVAHEFDNAPLILAQISRLFAEYNRYICDHDDQPTSFITNHVDGIRLPGNQDISEREMQERIEVANKFHGIVAQVASWFDHNPSKPLKFVDVHSFTPRFIPQAEILRLMDQAGETNTVSKIELERLKADIGAHRRDLIMSLLYKTDKPVEEEMSKRAISALCDEIDNGASDETQILRTLLGWHFPDLRLDELFRTNEPYRADGTAFSDLVKQNYWAYGEGVGNDIPSAALEMRNDVASTMPRLRQLILSVFVPILEREMDRAHQLHLGLSAERGKIADVLLGAGGPETPAVAA